jgi:hypothetical protein
MAKKQSRRSVSLNRALYDAAAELADTQGITLAQLVADSLRAAGVNAPSTWHMEPSVVARAVARREGTRAAVISPHRVLRRIDAIRARATGTEMP